MRKFWFVISLGLMVILLLPLTEVIAEPPARPVGQDMLAKLDSPLTNSFVQGKVQVKGSATHPQFNFYKVEFGPGESPPDDQMAIIGAIHEQQVTNGLLETWDTTIIPDGTYTLRLRVVDVTGNYQEDWVRRLSVNNTSPTPTSTPESVIISTPAFVPPTFTPTMIPPTPTIVVEQPFLNQPTATPPLPPTVENQPAPTSDTLVVEAEPTSTPLPQSTSTPAPNINDLFQPEEWGNALCFGALFMAGVFILFGALSLLRRLILILLSSR